MKIRNYATFLLSLLVIFAAAASIALFAVRAFGEEGPEMWCGLVVEPENRCSPYDKKKDYSYSPNVECAIVERDGFEFETSCNKRGDPRAGWITKPYPSPYIKGVRIRTIRDTDIEHIVAASEAHDSGMCKADVATRKRFAADLDNLTLALPYVNQRVKIGKDAAEWLPEKKRRWYANTIRKVKTKYGLSVDAAERDALAALLPNCGGTQGG